MGHMEVVQVLLYARASINEARKDQISPLFMCSQKGRTEMVEVLLVSRAAVNQASDKGASPLFIAAETGHTQVVKMLLNARADANQPATHAGQVFRPLSLAKDPAVVKALKDVG